MAPLGHSATRGFDETRFQQLIPARYLPSTGATIHAIAVQGSGLTTTVDYDLLPESNVSQPAAEVIEGLCDGDFEHVRHALRFLAKRASRRVSRANDPRQAKGRVSGSGHCCPVEPFLRDLAFVLPRVARDMS